MMFVDNDEKQFPLFSPAISSFSRICTKFCFANYYVLRHIVTGGTSFKSNGGPGSVVWRKSCAIRDTSDDQLYKPNTHRKGRIIYKTCVDFQPCYLHSTCDHDKEVGRMRERGKKPFFIRFMNAGNNNTGTHKHC